MIIIFHIPIISHSDGYNLGVFPRLFPPFQKGALVIPAPSPEHWGAKGFPLGWEPPTRVDPEKMSTWSIPGASILAAKPPRNSENCNMSCVTLLRIEKWISCSMRLYDEYWWIIWMSAACSLFIIEGELHPWWGMVPSKVYFVKDKLYQSHQHFFPNTQPHLNPPRNRISSSNRKLKLTCIFLKIGYPQIHWLLIIFIHFPHMFLLQMVLWGYSTLPFSPGSRGTSGHFAPWKVADLSAREAPWHLRSPRPPVDEAPPALASRSGWCCWDSWRYLGIFGAIWVYLEISWGSDLWILCDGSSSPSQTLAAKLQGMRLHAPVPDVTVAPTHPASKPRQTVSRQGGARRLMPQRMQIMTWRFNKWIWTLLNVTVTEWRLQTSARNCHGESMTWRYTFYRNSKDWCWNVVRNYLPNIRSFWSCEAHAWCCWMAEHGSIPKCTAGGLWWLICVTVGLYSSCQRSKFCFWNQTQSMREHVAQISNFKRSACPFFFCASGTICLWSQRRPRIYLHCSIGFALGLTDLGPDSWRREAESNAQPLGIGLKWV